MNPMVSPTLTFDNLPYREKTFCLPAVSLAKIETCTTQPIPRVSRIAIPESQETKRMQVRELIRLLEANGWELRNQSGSHRQFKKAGHPYLATVSGKPSSDVPAGTLSSILRNTGLKEHLKE
jgi:predicted RNA binding protein YcfA (HicA-like mRNA interferase family)